MIIKEIIQWFFPDRKTKYVSTPMGKIEYTHYKARYLKCTREMLVNGRTLRYNEFGELIESVVYPHVRNTFKK